jgi:hypothetical protein
MEKPYISENHFWYCVVLLISARFIEGNLIDYQREISFADYFSCLHEYKSLLYDLYPPVALVYTLDQSPIPVWLCSS